MYKYVCLNCGKNFESKEKTAKYCSKKCYGESVEKLDYSDCSTTKEKRSKYWRYYYNNVGKNKHKERVLKSEKTKYFKFQEYKKTLFCEICGENHPATLDFHHKNPLTKIDTITNLLRQKGWSFERLLQEEIPKCQVLCSNCHRKLHYEENNQ